MTTATNMLFTSFRTFRLLLFVQTKSTTRRPITVVTFPPLSRMAVVAVATTTANFGYYSVMGSHHFKMMPRRHDHHHRGFDLVLCKSVDWGEDGNCWFLFSIPPN
jgi:hypothetical protein